MNQLKLTADQMPMRPAVRRAAVESTALMEKVSGSFVPSAQKRARIDVTPLLSSA